MEPKKIFYISIDEADGMDAISLVCHPAVNVNFLKFSSNEKIELKFDEDKHIITGVVCLADTPIYRYTEGLGEWYAVFTKETIQKMIVKYSKNNLWNSVNLEHNDDLFVDNVIMLESYIKDSKRGIVPQEFANIPDGSWIASFYVANNDVWEVIKNSNILNGFSLQGMFDIVPEIEKEPEEIDEIEKLISDCL